MKRRRRKRPLPRQRWVNFWEADPRRLDVRRHADYIIGRIVEFGAMDDVRWLIATYGLDRIHTFFREQGQVEILPRTIAFWRAVLRAEDEPWADPYRDRMIALSGGSRDPARWPASTWPADPR